MPLWYRLHDPDLFLGRDDPGQFFRPTSGQPMSGGVQVLAQLCQLASRSLAMVARPDFRPTRGQPVGAAPSC